MTYHLFEAVGIELEYVIADAASLDVRPAADELLRAASGAAEFVADHEDPSGITWSNELAAHVIEMKTGEPARSLAGLSEKFHRSISRANTLLAPRGMRLLPTGMHPWMDPLHEMKLWPHEGREIYETFDRIFGCRGHGWANLQSMHLNLPFHGDAEFARLHAAIRLLLPIIPALAASSPIVEGRATGLLDTRMEVYRDNARKGPGMTGLVVPEPVFSRADYDRVIYGPIRADIARLDPGGTLQPEWSNARGAIARFERGSIEIRVIDSQECPAADLAIAAIIIDTLKSLVEERWSPIDAQQAWPVGPLHAQLLSCIRDAERAPVLDETYARALGHRPARARPPTASDLWRTLLDAALARPDSLAHGREPALRFILDRGPLARRILTAAGPAPSRDALRAVYARLADALETNTLFDPRG